MIIIFHRSILKIYTKKHNAIIIIMNCCVLCECKIWSGCFETANQMYLCPISVVWNLRWRDSDKQ